MASYSVTVSENNCYRKEDLTTKFEIIMRPFVAVQCVFVTVICVPYLIWQQQFLKFVH
jgi:hypothetical protein